VATRDQKFRQAAWAYFAYGLVYWVGGLVLQAQGFGPRGMERSGAAWFVVGALFVLVFPWLLAREWPLFDRFVLSRRDFARLLALLVALRAWEVSRIARTATGQVTVAPGVEVAMGTGAWAFFAVTVGAAFMVSRAAWSRAA
jgi:hypothetical protein